MPEIQEIGIQTINVQGVPPSRVISPPTLPAEPPVTLMLGFPVADIPGGEIPYYEPLDFTPGEHSHRSAPKPRIADDIASEKEAEEKPAGGSGQPVSAPSPALPLEADQLKVETELPCPPPDAIPLGAKNKAQTAVIIGYEVVDGKCEQQLKPLDLPAIISNYTPSPALVMSTAAVATTATTAAIIARPLGNFLLKVIKPTVKKVIKKIDEKRGKKVVFESVSERRKFQRSLKR